MTETCKYASAANQSIALAASPNGDVDSSSCGGGEEFGQEDARGAKFACVKVVGTIDARVGDVYKLFLDNERVQVSGQNGCGNESGVRVWCVPL